MPHWQRNLLTVWAVHFITVAGYLGVAPLLPLFVAELGVPEEREVALWSGVAQGAGAFTLFLCSPLWGALSDLYGRRLNLLRALLGTAVVQAVTGLAWSVPALIVFRLLGGATAGAFAPAQALVASSTPRERLPSSLAFLETTWPLGTIVGPAAAGLAASIIGLRGAFYASGLLIFGAFVATLLFTREQFVRPATARRPTLAGELGQLRSVAASRTLGPVFALLGVLLLAELATHPVLPLYVTRFLPGAPAAQAAGLAFSAIALGAAAGSFLASVLARHMELSRGLPPVAVALAALFPLMALVGNAAQLFTLLAVLGVAIGFLFGAATGVLGLLAPREGAGRVFGTLQGILALAVSAGPLVGGAVARQLGLAAVFPATGLLCVGLAAIAWWVRRTVRAERLAGVREAATR